MNVIKLLLCLLFIVVANAVKEEDIFRATAIKEEDNVRLSNFTSVVKPVWSKPPEHVMVSDNEIRREI